MENLNKVLDEIEKLKEARELLNEIWYELGAYNNQLSTELNIKIQNFYDFDDSE